VSPRPTVFVSYSHRDKRWLERLQVHLKPSSRRGEMVLWDDTRIDPGDLWRPAIRSAVQQAAVSILLISADFLASDFVTSEELPALLHRAERAGARVIPIIVQPCRLANHPELASFQTLNSPDRPLSKLTDAEAEEVFVRATEELERVLRAYPHTAGRFDAPDAADLTLDEAASEELFRELRLPAMALSVLLALTAAGTRGYTLTDLTRVLGASSRKLVFDAVDRLFQAGWLEKRKESGHTAYQVANEGARQVQRLAAMAEGPLRSSFNRR
jgi:hypothetical protein